MIGVAWCYANAHNRPRAFERDTMNSIAERCVDQGGAGGDSGTSTASPADRQISARLRVALYEYGYELRMARAVFGAYREACLHGTAEEVAQRDEQRKKYEGRVDSARAHLDALLVGSNP